MTRRVSGVPVEGVVFFAFDVLDFNDAIDLFTGNRVRQGAARDDVIPLQACMRVQLACAASPYRSRCATGLWFIHRLFIVTEQLRFPSLKLFLSLCLKFRQGAEIATQQVLTHYA